MRLTLRAWNAPYECLQSEEDSLYNMDRYNKTRYSRRKKKEGLLELASREAHENQEVYFATILNDDDSPYCAMESNVGYFGFDFLQDNYADFLTFQYRSDSEHKGKLFLKAIFLFECYNGTSEVIQTKHPPISAEELEKLWVDYPKFGEYEQLIRLDRIPLLARERILEYTDKEFLAFREYLQRDIERYQHPME